MFYTEEDGIIKTFCSIHLHRITNFGRNYQMFSGIIFTTINTNVESSSPNFQYVLQNLRIYVFQ